jgi:heme A synthase
MAGQKEKQPMSFGLYLLGWIVVIAGLAWGAMVAGVPQTYILIGAVILLGIGIISAVKRTRPKDPPEPGAPAGGRRAEDRY